MPELLAGELVLDYGLYPRTQVSQTHVSELAQAIEAGATLPPVLIDRATRRVVDGFHRTSAMLRARGADARIAVEERDYATEEEFFLDAVRTNTTHGLRISQFDRARIMTQGRELLIDEARLAGALQVPKEFLERLTARKTATGPTGLTVPVKGIAPHLHGKPVTDRQIGAMERASGMKLTFHVNQIIRAIHGDLVNRESEQTISSLWLLREELDKFLGPASGPEE